MDNEINRLENKLENDKLTEIVLMSDAAAREGQDTSRSFGSGFTDIDNCINGGFREGDFNIISGVPGDGKTTLARMFTLNFASKEVPTLWFSYEMSNRELWDEFVKMGAQTSMISYVPLELHDDLDWLLKHALVGIQDIGIKAIFIDTLGDVVKSVKKQQEMSNYATYLAQICKDLRVFAIKNKVMIFAIAHAVKNTRSRSNETDNMDIANSNGIPAAATNIFHVWRDNEKDFTSYIKIGKSRRDGRAKGKTFQFTFQDWKLVPQGAYNAKKDTLHF